MRITKGIDILPRYNVEEDKKIKAQFKTSGRLHNLLGKIKHATQDNSQREGGGGVTFEDASMFIVSLKPGNISGRKLPQR